MDLSPLEQFLPPKTLPLFEAWLTPHPFRIVVTRPRRSKLGDFRSSPYEDRPTITVNGDLEPHQFALTLTHEIAHLMTFEKYGHRIRAHGPEWKSCFGMLLTQLAAIESLPITYRRALLAHAQRPKSASVYDPALYRILRQLSGDDGLVLDDLPSGSRFIFQSREFEKISTARSRCECLELSTGLRYKISKIASVSPISKAQSPYEAVTEKSALGVV